MKRVNLMVGLVLVAGCASATVETVSFESIPPTMAQEIRERSREQTARVTLAWDEVIEVSSISFRMGLVSWLDPATGGVLPRPDIRSIREIRFDGRGPGAGTGALIGLLLGLGAGAALAEDSWGGSMLVLPPVGALLGFVTGAPGERVFRAPSPELVPSATSRPHR